MSADAVTIRSGGRLIPSYESTKKFPEAQLTDRIIGMNWANDDQSKIMQMQAIMQMASKLAAELGIQFNAPSLEGIQTTITQPINVRAFLEKSIEEELQEQYFGRNLVSKVFRFPNNSKWYQWRRSDSVRAAIVPELGAPPIVHPSTKAFTLTYYKVETATGVSDEMHMFGDTVAVQNALVEAKKSLKLKQDRDITNNAIGSVHFLSPGTPAESCFVKAQNADALWGEWRVLELVAGACPMGNSHVINGAGTPLTDAPTNAGLIGAGINRAKRLINEHPTMDGNLCVVSPFQAEDLANFYDFNDGTNFHAVPDYLNQMMQRGWIGRWYGVDFIENAHMAPGTSLMMDTTKAMVLGEWSAPTLEGDIRDAWHGWDGSIFRQFYCPATIYAEAIVLFLNCNGDVASDDGLAADHTGAAATPGTDITDQYTGLTAPK